MLEGIINLNVVLEILAYSAEAFAIIILAMYLFIKLTPYNELEEIRSGGPYNKGNKAVAFDYAGKVIAVSKIVATAIFTCKGFIAIAVWGFIGIAMLAVVFEIFEHFMKDDKHTALKDGKESRGIFSCAISLAIMFVITSVIF